MNTPTVDTFKGVKFIRSPFIDDKGIMPGPHGSWLIGSAVNLEELVQAANYTPRVWNKRDKYCPTDAVYIGRPTELGNPYSHLRPASFSGGIYVPSRKKAVEEFALYALSMVQTTPEFKAAVLALAGKHLVCWCAPALCHGDVLLYMANRPESDWTWKNLSKHLQLG